MNILGVISKILALFFFFNAGLLTAQEITGRQIMEMVDKRPIPKDFKSTTIMKLIDKRGKVRERSINSYRMGDDKQIMWFIKPADVKGSSFLRISYDERDDDMWLYLPSFGKVRRIASHAKKGSFMGSDFTYEDIGDRKLDEYTYKLIKEETIEGKDCWLVESTPNKGVVTDYSKIESWISKEALVQIVENYYDKRSKLKKKMNREMSKIENFWMAVNMKMENLKTKHKTEIIIDNIEINIGLNEDFFKTASLKRIR